MRFFNTLLILLCLTLIAMTGCDALVDRVVPISVGPQAPEYVGQKPKDIYSLHEIKQIRDEILIEHRDVQLDLKRLSEDDTYAYQDATGFIETAIEDAETFKERVIGDDNNPLSLSGLLFMATGGLVGRSFFKRPGDLTLDEARAKGAEV